MAKIVNMYPNVDPIDEDLKPEVLDFVNRRAKEISDHFYFDLTGSLRSKKTDSFLAIDSLRYLIKRAIIEGIQWQENKID